MEANIGRIINLINYVETVLLDDAFHTPNATTFAAIKEVASGFLRNAPALDLSSNDAIESR